MGLPAVLTVLGAVAAEPLAKRIVPPRFLVLIGDASYSIYLVHIIALGLTRGVFRSVFQSGDWWVSLFVPTCILVSVVAGIVFYFVVEKPLVDTANKAVLRERGAASA